MNKTTKILSILFVLSFTVFMYAVVTTALEVHSDSVCRGPVYLQCECNVSVDCCCPTEVGPQATPTPRILSATSTKPPEVLPTHTRRAHDPTTTSQPAHTATARPPTREPTATNTSIPHTAEPSATPTQPDASPSPSSTLPPTDTPRPTETVISPTNTVEPTPEWGCPYTDCEEHHGQYICRCVKLCKAHGLRGCGKICNDCWDLICDP